jgi:succinyl-diaminopimelate desuccinylase
MANPKEELLRWVNEDRDKLVDFLSQFLQAKSPNPPGNTKEAVDYVCRFLEAHQLPYRIISPHPDMPNIVGSFDCGSLGRHLGLNGHIDVFPVGDEKWTYGPWSGSIANGRIYGRGVTDMKCGTTASIFTFAYLHRIRNRLKGRVTLTAVSDEETFGPYGARYLMEHHPEVHGDCLLNGEPSTPYTVRFGEKGLLWLRCGVRTPGCHGAYTHLSESATKIACRLISDLEAVTAIEASPPENVRKALMESEAAVDKALGRGASKVVRQVTLSIGVIRGGLKVNMVPGHCEFEADIRLPVGVEKDQIIKKVERILSPYPQVTVEEINFTPPSWCDPYGEMTGYLKSNVKALRGFEPTAVISLGGTDARLWRYRNVPAYVYGPSPIGMGSFDEYVDIEEFLHVVRTHVLSAYDYLSRG